MPSSVHSAETSRLPPGPCKLALIVASDYLYFTDNANQSEGTSGNQDPEGDYAGRLRTPCKDASQWRTLLIDRFGFPPENVRVLVDEESHCPNTTTSHPSPGLDTTASSDGIHQHDPRIRPRAANLKRELISLKQRSRPGDTLFFFFAGHVGQVTCEEHTEMDGQDEAIVLPEHYQPWPNLDIPSRAQANHSSWLKDNELKKLLIDDLPSGVRLLCVVDACHSGTLFDLPHGPCNMLPFVGNPLRQKSSLSDASALSRQTSSPDTPSRRQSSDADGISPSPRTLMADKWIRKLSLDAAMKSPGKGHIALARLLPKSRHFSLDSSLADARSAISSDSPTQDAETFFADSLLTNVCESPLSASTPSRTVLDNTPMCGPQCMPDPNYVGPLVVTISACMDEQVAWESEKRGGSLTRFLIPFLQAHPTASYRKIMEHLRNNMYGIVHKAHNNYRKARAAGNSETYMGPDYQDPQLCSTTPLVHDQPFLLSL